MLNLCISPEAILDLHILYGEDAMGHYFDELKGETLRQIEMLKKSGAYQEYSDKLHESILEKLNVQDRFDNVKATLEDIGFVVYKMSQPITIVGDMPLAAKSNRFIDMAAIEKFYKSCYDNGIKTIYLYKVHDDDGSYVVRATWHLDANEVNDRF